MCRDVQTTFLYVDILFITSFIYRYNNILIIDEGIQLMKHKKIKFFRSDFNVNSFFLVFNSRGMLNCFVKNYNVQQKIEKYLYLFCHYHYLY